MLRIGKWVVHLTGPGEAVLEDDDGLHLRVLTESDDVTHPACLTWRAEPGGTEAAIDAELVMTTLCLRNPARVAWLFAERLFNHGGAAQHDTALRWSDLSESIAGIETLPEPPPAREYSHGGKAVIVGPSTIAESVLLTAAGDEAERTERSMHVPWSIRFLIDQETLKVSPPGEEELRWSGVPEAEVSQLQLLAADYVHRNRARLRSIIETVHRNVARRRNYIGGL